MEKSWWEPVITIPAFSAIPHCERLLMDLSDLGPPQDVGHQDWVPKGGGEEQDGNKREGLGGDTGTHSDPGEGRRQLFASPGSLLKCRQG